MKQLVQHTSANIYAEVVCNYGHLVEQPHLIGKVWQHKKSGIANTQDEAKIPNIEGVPTTAQL